MNLKTLSLPAGPACQPRRPWRYPPLNALIGGTLLAALTTWLSFGLLAVSSTPAVSNFGLSVSLGLAFSFILAPWAGKQEHRA